MDEDHNGTLIYPTYNIMDITDNGTDNGYLATPSYPLYNIQDDPTEHFDISANNTYKVNQMIAMMQDMKATGVPPATNDPNCPPITHPNSTVGPVWDPWCGV